MLIKLLSFNARKNDDVVDLTWTTETEVNNNYFTLERSADGFEFSNCTVPGAGNSTQELNYARTDYNSSLEYPITVLNKQIISTLFTATPLPFDLPTPIKLCERWTNSGSATM
ncbi:MAG: hypothetical protein U0X76_00085 [Bacteroidia bacterium]